MTKILHAYHKNTQNPQFPNFQAWFSLDQHCPITSPNAWDISLDKFSPCEFGQFQDTCSINKKINLLKEPACFKIPILFLFNSIEMFNFF